MPGEGRGASAHVQDAFYETLFRQALDAQLVLGSDGRLHDVNESCVRLLDANDQEELIGCHFMEFLPEWERPRAGERFEVAIGGEPRLNTFTIRTLEGRHRIIETIGTPVDTPSGRNLFMVLRDVTTRERLARARDLVGAIATAANQARTDRELGEAAVQAAHEILGARVAVVCAVGERTPDLELLGASGVNGKLREALESDGDFTEPCTALEALRRREPIVVPDLTQEPLSGAFARYVREHNLQRAIAAPGIVGGEPLAVLVVAKPAEEPFQPGDEDLVQQAAQQIALWLERHRLLDRLQRMNRARSTAMRQLERQRSELEAFTYTVSHDLKEPLRAVEVFAKILVDEYADQMPDEASDISRRACQNAVRLRGMLDDILRLSRATTRTGAPSVVDVTEVVEDVASDLSVSIRERGARLHVAHPLPSVRADPTRVREVLSNLLGNALKFNDKDEPEIWVEADPADDGVAEFRVADNGPGIDPEEYDRVFELFHRGAAGESAPGTGAGLAIVKRILASYGGDTWISPRRGGGTVFHFTLPEADPAEGEKS